jgi:putative lipoprotein
MRLLLLPVLAALSACQSISAPPPASNRTNEAAIVTLNGAVSYRQRIALPPDARLQVTISDVSLMDAPATVIAQAQIETAGRQVPIPFALDYDRARIVAGRTYAVSARITDAAGGLIWITDTRFDLPAPGTPANLTLVPVSR